MSQPTIIYFKTGDVKDPVRAHASDAGVDFFIPNDAYPVTIKPNETKMFNLKIKTSFPEGHVLMLCDKSGVAAKRNLKVLGGIVDSSYQGEILLQLANVGSKDVTVEPGDKIVQGLLLPIRLPSLFSCKTEEEYLLRAGGVSERGAGGHGSTGSK